MPVLCVRFTTPKRQGRRDTADIGYIIETGSISIMIRVERCQLTTPKNSKLDEKTLAAYIHPEQDLGTSLTIAAQPSM